MKRDQYYDLPLKTKQKRAYVKPATFIKSNLIYFWLGKNVENNPLGLFGNF